MGETQDKAIVLQPIGHVRSVRSEPVDEGWGTVTSDVVIDEVYRDGLLGLEQFSHAVIVFWMNGAHYEQARHIRRRPQGREDMPMMGIFAQRAKDRPNPIGVTTVEVLEVQADRIRVRGLDAIDATPVLDVKPYFRCFDAGNETKEPEWVDQLMGTYF